MRALKNLVYMGVGWGGTRLTHCLLHGTSVFNLSECLCKPYEYHVADAFSNMEWVRGDAGIYFTTLASKMNPDS